MVKEKSMGGVIPDIMIRERLALPEGHPLRLVIEPFQEHTKVIGRPSHGLGSFGYDLVLGEDFYYVDPMLLAQMADPAIDPMNMAAMKAAGVLRPWRGESFTIPAGGFVLAETLEVVRVPRDFLGIVLGKCVAGSTRVVDAATGDYVPIREAESVTATPSMIGGRIVPSPVSAFTRSGRQRVFELYTSSGRRITATATHPFFRASGWTRLGELRPGDKIAAPAVVPCFGRGYMPEWEAALLGFMTSDGQCDTPGHSPTFTGSDGVLVAAVERYAQDGLSCPVTYKGRYGYRLVNRAGRGGLMTENRATAWLRSFGLTVGAREKFVPSRLFRSTAQAVRVYLRALFSGDGGVCQTTATVEYGSSSRRLAEDVRHLLSRFGIVSSVYYRPKTESFRVAITSGRMVRRFANAIGFWPGSVKSAALAATVDSIRVEQSEKCRSLPEDARPLVGRALANAGLSWKAGGVKPSRPVSAAQLVELAERTGDPHLRMLARGDLVWDEIVGVIPAGEDEVFDLSVPDGESFIANDLIVHNSTYARLAINLNMTPIEPEWRGKITIEIGNTSGFPARVHAGMGIGQIVFYRADLSRAVGRFWEHPDGPDRAPFTTAAGCVGSRSGWYWLDPLEKSYADRAIQTYQNQAGVTPALV